MDDNVCCDFYCILKHTQPFKYGYSCNKSILLITIYSFKTNIFIY